MMMGGHAPSRLRNRRDRQRPAEADVPVAVFLLKFREAHRVRRCAAQIVGGLAYGAEAARREVRNSAEPVKILGRQRRLEHPLEKESLALVLKIVELELERESAHDRCVEVRHEVRRPYHHALEILHLVEEFVHLRHLPAVAGHGAILHKPVNLV